MRILIMGGPRTGKTTLSLRLSTENKVTKVLHGDDLIGTHDWSKASEEISHWMEDEGSWVIEGVQVVRALRKWLERHPYGVPFDRLFALEQPLVKLTARQKAMSKGHQTIYDEIKPEILRRGTYALKSHKAIWSDREVQKELNT